MLETWKTIQSKNNWVHQWKFVFLDLNICCHDIPIAILTRCLRTKTYISAILVRAMFLHITDYLFAFLKLVCIKKFIVRSEILNMNINIINIKYTITTQFIGCSKLQKKSLEYYDILHLLTWLHDLFEQKGFSTQ